MNTTSRKRLRGCWLREWPLKEPQSWFTASPGGAQPDVSGAVEQAARLNCILAHRRERQRILLDLEWLAAVEMLALQLQSKMR